ncbi:cystathionine beta-synthase [Coemansia erecta]|uniref:Cystathionine beta-synthase n=1 Tax=Coemansia erecta TaxID=147472 RepID=A0A9W8CRB1_9FUNG|nr:cystathionine beta-synthase [Coemansia erecta]
MTDHDMACTCDVAPGNQPHRHRELQPEPPILSSILDHIGNTPLVRLSRLARSEGLQCELLAKCEYFNAGGSVKDRIAHRILEEAEADGRIRPGFTIIEATSGNTGIGLALACAVKGYKCIITLPEKMSQEKVDILRALGAQIIRTPTEAAWDSPQSHISVANRLHKEIPDSIILGQYTSPYNPVAHYDTTAEEILRACGNQLDMLVLGAGTGGTLTGIARRIKERCPECIIVGVDPVGSILAQPDALNSASTAASMYYVEGIGYDFIPETLDRSIVDHWIKISDKPSFAMARRLIREEGILCGGSSGSAVYAAIEAARRLEPGKRVVTVLPDSVRNYMTRFLNDDWMDKHDFLDRDEEMRKQNERDAMWTGARVKDLNLKRAVVVEINMPVMEAVELMKANGFDQLPVITTRGILRGIVTLGNVLSLTTTGRITSGAKVRDVMFRFQTGSSKKFREITPETPLGELDHFFENNIAGIVTERLSIDEERVAFTPVHVITAVDMLSYLMSRNKDAAAAAAASSSS